MAVPILGGGPQGPKAMVPFIPERVDGIKHGYLEIERRGGVMRIPIDAMGIALPPDEDGTGERVVLIQAQHEGHDVGFVMMDPDAARSLIEALQKAVDHITEMRVRDVLEIPQK